MHALCLQQLSPYLSYCFFRLGHVDQSSGALLVQFAGQYRYGGAGNRDADFMAGAILQGCACWHPWNVVVDLSRVWYQWGDQIADALSMRYETESMAVVIGPDCAAALATLWFGKTTHRPATDREGVFASIKDARRYLCQEPWEARPFEAPPYFLRPCA